MRFAGIHPDAFCHDEDKAALAALRTVPGLDVLLKAVGSSTLEEQMHAHHSQTTIQLGPTQYPSLHAMVERAATTLDIDTPDVFLSSAYTINATAFGFKRYTITLYSGLVDLLDDDELQFVIGHEVGHIKCEHMLYKSMSLLISQLGVVVLGRVLGGLGSLVTGPVELALARWSRAAELTCDRAGLLVLRKPEKAASALAALAGTSTRFRQEFNLAAVLQQAHEFDRSASVTAKVMDNLRQLSATHPDPVKRARQIIIWSESPQYRAILAGNYLTVDDAHRQELGRIVGLQHCADCHAVVESAWRFCRSCGATTRAAGS